MLCVGSFWHSKPQTRALECRYENLIQVRCLLEGVEVEDILNNWHRILPEYMEKWGLERKEVGDVLEIQFDCYG